MWQFVTLFNPLNQAHICKAMAWNVHPITYKISLFSLKWHLIKDLAGGLGFLTWCFEILFH